MVKKNWGGGGGGYRLAHGLHSELDSLLLQVSIFGSQDTVFVTVFPTNFGMKEQVDVYISSN